VHTLKLLHKTLEKSCPEIHKARLNALMQGVEDSSHCKSLTLTNLGRGSKEKSHVKHKIKRIDRLIGNVKLQTEVKSLYKAMAEYIIGEMKHPIILVDWASVDNRNKYQVLKASIAYQGRAITIYDLVEYTDRPKKETNNSHDVFIEELSEILPNGCRPVIISDAGFTPKWFKRIEKKDWYWVGRIRGLIKMKKLDSAIWQTCGDLHTVATKTPKELGIYALSKKNTIVCKLFIYKSIKKGRKQKNYNGTEKKVNPRSDYKKAGNEPWLLAGKLPANYKLAEKVVRCYRTRMQIEETFRDIKDPRYGLGIRHTLSNCRKRIAILLLIANLVLFIFGIVGRAAYESGINKRFQANTVSNRRVLSFWYLGKQVWDHMLSAIPIQALEQACINMMEDALCYESL